MPDEDPRRPDRFPPDAEPEPEFLSEVPSVNADGTLHGSRPAPAEPHPRDLRGEEPELELELSPRKARPDRDLAAEFAPAPSATRWRGRLVGFVLIALVVAGALLARPYLPRLRAALTPPPAATETMLFVDSLPSDADVFVDGEHAGQTPIAVARRGIPGTAVEVRVEKRGFRPAVRTVTLEAETRVRVQLRAR